MKFIAVNRKTGMRRMKARADTIMEAFKPGTGPADSFSVIGGEANYASTERDSEELRRQAHQAVTGAAAVLF
jgi:penicillin-binding protein 1A